MESLKLAVIGKDVSQSDSPRIHSFIAAATGRKVDYVALSVSETEFEERICGLFCGLDGFNVTIPYKISVIPYLVRLQGDAQIFGAVNTVKTSDKSGYNTDGSGFALMLKNGGADVKDKKVLLLGAGGAGRSAAKKLSDGGAQVFIYDKSYEKARGVAAEFKAVTALRDLSAARYYAIINATGVGMHDTEGVSPVDGSLTELCDTAVDLIYRPRQSKFLRIAANYGKKTINGEAMLFYQAYFSQCIYFGISPDEDEAKRLFAKYKEVFGQ